MQSLYQRQVEAILGGLGVAPSGKLYGIMPGDKVRVKATLQYRGPALTDYFYAAIGEWRGVTWPADIGYFDEIWQATSSAITFGPSSAWAPYNLQVDISITEIGLFPWTPGWFDIYGKILNENIVSSRYDNVIEVLLKPQFQNFNITDYSKA